MIEIIHTRENEDDQTVFFKITIGKETFEWHGDCPKDADPKKFFESMINKIHFLILLKQYPGADYRAHKTEDDSDLDAMIKWIKNGCKNVINFQTGEDDSGDPIFEEITTIIAKKEFRSTHPPTLKLKTEIDDAKDIDELKEIIKKLI